MPAIAYTSGAPWWELPTISGRAWEPFGHPGSVFGFQGSAGGFASDPLKIAQNRFARQPLLTGSLIGTQRQGPHLVREGTARRARNYHAGGPAVKR